MFQFIFNILAFQTLTIFGANGSNTSFQKGYKYEEFNETMFKELFPHVIEGDGYTEYRLQKGGLSKLFEAKLPDFFDWRDKRMVSPVKDQARCQACWAFSAVGALESHVKIHAKREEMMSEQFLVDCIHDDGYYPHCGSFTVTKTYALLSSSSALGGVLKIDDYRPYNAHFKKCGFHSAPPYPVPVMGFVRVKNKEDEMVRQLYLQGPLSAAINSKSMDVYKGHNIIDEPTEEQCSSDPKHLDHAVVIVGYNVYVGEGRVVPYWIIKNSWGPKWGSSGFYYLVRGRNACGIANDVSFPVTS